VSVPIHKVEPPRMSYDDLDRNDLEDRLHDLWKLVDVIADEFAAAGYPSEAGELYDSSWMILQVARRLS